MGTFYCRTCHIETGEIPEIHTDLERTALREQWLENRHKEVVISQWFDLLPRKIQKYLREKGIYPVGWLEERVEGRQTTAKYHVCPSCHAKCYFYV